MITSVLDAVNIRFGYVGWGRSYALGFILSLVVLGCFAIENLFSFLFMLFINPFVISFSIETYLVILFIVLLIHPFVISIENLFSYFIYCL